jgi:hypothetical protein
MKHQSRRPGDFRSPSRHWILKRLGKRITVRGNILPGEQLFISYFLAATLAS